MTMVQITDVQETIESRFPVALAHRSRVSMKLLVSSGPVLLLCGTEIVRKSIGLRDSCLGLHPEKSWAASCAASECVSRSSAYYWYFGARIASQEGSLVHILHERQVLEWGLLLLFTLLPSYCYGIALI